MSRRRRWLVAACFVLAAAVWLIGVDEAFLFGHSGWCAARRALAGVNFERYGFLATGFGPVENPGPVAPEHFEHYWHHPVGIHLLVGASFRLLGDGEWQARGVATALMLASLLLFWRLARRWWGPAGLLAGLVFFATTPMLGYYGPFVGQEPLVLLACLAAALLHARAVERPGWGVAAAAAGAAFLSAWSDWPWLLFAFALAVGEIARLAARRSLDLRWLVLFSAGVLAGLGAVLAHLVALQGAPDWISGFERLFAFRSGGESRTVARLLSVSGDRWVELFTPTLLVAGLAWLALEAGRGARRLAALAARPAPGRAPARRPPASGPAPVALAFLFTGVTWTLTFRQGAIVHEYWPILVAPFLVIAGADLVDRLDRALAACHAPRTAPRRAAAALVGLLVLLQGVSGVAGVLQRHRVPDHKEAESDGWRYRHVVLARWLADRLPEDARVALHDRVLAAKFQVDFYLRRDRKRVAVRGDGAFAPRGAAVAAVDLRAAPQQGQARLLGDAVARHPVTVLEDFLVMDLRRPADAPDVTWLNLRPRPAGPLHRWLVSLAYPPSELARDPLLEAWLLLSTGHGDEALARYAEAGPAPDTWRHRVAADALERAAGRAPDRTWLGGHAPPGGPLRFGDALELVAWRVDAPARHARELHAVFRVLGAPGEGWRPYLDRFSREARPPHAERRASFDVRAFPSPDRWRRGDLAYLRAWLPLNEHHGDPELRLGFWRPAPDGRGSNQHLRVGDEVGWRLPVPGAEPAVTYPPWLAWLDLRWSDRESD